MAYTRPGDPPPQHIEFHVAVDGVEPDYLDFRPAYPQTFHGFTSLPAELRIKIWKYLMAPRVVVAAVYDDAGEEESEDLRKNNRAKKARMRRIGTASGEGGSEAQGIGKAVTTDEGATAATTSSSTPRQASFKEPCYRPSNRPILLHVSSETRTLALSHYILTFSTTVPLVFYSTLTRTPPRVWFNFTSDTLYLAGDLAPYQTHCIMAPISHYLLREDILHIRNLAYPFHQLGFHTDAMTSGVNVYAVLSVLANKFPAAKGRIMITTRKKDRERHDVLDLLGGPSRDNALMEIWRRKLRILGSPHARDLEDVRVWLMREEEIVDFVSGDYGDEEREAGSDKKGKGKEKGAWSATIPTR